jgi:membrane protease YdiL (CAAX protease family)
MKRYLKSQAAPYLLYAAVLFLWLVRLQFDAVLHHLFSPTGVWADTIIKFVFFALPALFFMNPNRLQPRGWWLGLLVGLLYFGMRLSADVLFGDSEQRWQPWTSEIPRFADVLIEEMLFRLALLPLLEKQLSFRRANLVQGLMFIGVHLPGWSLQGLPLTVILEYSLGVLVVGLVCGYLNQRTHSIWAGVAFHWCWNFTAFAVVLT